MPCPMVLRTIKGMEKANNATIMPTTPQTTKFLASSISFISPPAVKNLKLATINITTANATKTGHNMENIISIIELTVRLGAAFGTPPGLKARMIFGICIKAIAMEKVMLQCLFLINLQIIDMDKSE
jgi:hypothetical protein